MASFSVKIVRCLLERGDYCLLHVSQPSGMRGEFLATVMYFDQTIMLDTMVAMNFVSNQSEQNAVTQADGWIEANLSGVRQRVEVPQVEVPYNAR